MAVDASHPAYDANIGKWSRCRDVYEGDDAIKERGMQYLPRIDENQTVAELRIPTKPAGYSRAKSAMHSNLIAATLPI